MRVLENYSDNREFTAAGQLKIIVNVINLSGLIHRINILYVIFFLR